MKTGNKREYWMINPVTAFAILISIFSLTGCFDSASHALVETDNESESQTEDDRNMSRTEQDSQHLKESIYSDGSYRLPRADRYPSPLPAGRRNNGQINISSFSFRDIDHNGRYDLQEQSLYGAKIMLIDLARDPERAVSVKGSNKAGFSNFPMSASRDTAEIARAGKYLFVAMPPPGMFVSSGNAIQKFTVFAAPGAIGDLAIEAMPTPVGFAVKPRISGRLGREEKAVLDISSVDAAERMTEIKTGSNRRFSVDLPDLKNRRFIMESANIRYERYLNPGAGAVVVSSIPDLMRQIRLDRRTETGTRTLASFDDLISGTEVRKVPHGYRNLGWDNITAIHNKFSNGIGYHNVVISGNYSAYTSSGQTGMVFSDTPFDFTGGYFCVGHVRRIGETIILQGYEGENLVYEDSFELSPYYPVYFQADYLGITRLTMRTTHYWQIAMDNLEFRVY